MKNLTTLAILALICGCASDAKPLVESYRRWLNGPGRQWVEAAKADPALDQSDAMDRQARWDVASQLVSEYE